MYIDDHELHDCGRRVLKLMIIILLSSCKIILYLI